MPNSRKKTLPYVILFLVIIITTLLLIFLKKEPNRKEVNIDDKKVTVQSNSLNQEEKNLIEKASKLVSMPTDETPTIATVVDKTKNEDDQFLKSAENGDKIIIFPKNKKKFLYRESTNQIIAQIDNEEE